MSAQINLFHPRFLKKRDLLTLDYVALACAVLYVTIMVSGAWVRQEAATRSQAAATAQSQLKALKAQFEETSQAVGQRRPSPQLLAELAAAEELLRRRSEITRLLESGELGSMEGFTGHFRGLARQVPDGLWLTGLTIGGGGSEIEIRGGVLNPSVLPGFLGRLGAEQAFRGRHFAALAITRDVSAAPPREGALADPSQGAASRPGTLPALAALGTSLAIPAPLAAPPAAAAPVSGGIEFVLTHKSPSENRDARQ